jgi:hypothetical protein
MTWLRKVQRVQVVVMVLVVLALFFVSADLSGDNWIEGFIDSVV